MRKFFLLIPALVLSLFTNAAVINITPTSPYDTHDNLRLALYYANPGDEIVLADGTYDEHDNYLYFDKNVTVRAAEGASPVIDMLTYAQIKSGANVRIEGLKFNGAAQGSYSYYIRFYDNSSSSLVLDGCEFYSVKNYVLYGNSSSHTNSLIVNNCYFHNNVKNAIYFEASGTEGVQTCDRLEVRNTTIANTDALTNYTSTIDIRPYGSAVTDAIKVIIDHCTFYNNPTINTDHSAIRPYNLSDVTISNCIFAHPEAYERRATCCYGGTISNCLTFNLTTDASQNAHRQSGGLPVFSGNFTADPLFNDLANNKYTFNNNWVTMSISPAVAAATDGSDLGDPRWYSAEVLPSVDFASPYQFVGAKALLAGNIWYDSENGYLYGEGGSNKDYGTATWKFHAEKACIVGVAVNLNSGNTSGHKLRVEVLDADGNKVDEFAEQASTLPGTLTIPAVGDYKIILHDDQEWSSAMIDNITFSYIGGDVQAMPGTTNINDAWFSAEGTRADGKIDFPDGSIQDGWVKWNVAFVSAADYNVIVNIDNENGHNYTVALYTDESDASPIVLSEGSQKGTIGTIELGTMTVPAGNYILKVTNAIQYSDAKLISVKFEYNGGGIVTIPGTIALNEAILSERAYVDADGLHFVDAEHLWLMSEGYAKWNIHVAADGMYKFTANCNTYETSYSYLTIKVLQGGEEKYSYTPQYTYTGEKEINSPEWFLEAGDYELKLSNPANNSNGYLVSLSAAQVEGILIVDEMATDMQYITDVNGLSMKPLLKRSFTGGMYNTVVFPFNGVSDAELTTIFGAGYELLEMTSAILEGNTLNLNFSAVDLSQATYGRPYLIKPTQDVVNPMFSSKTIYASTSHLVNSSTNAEFIGSFIAGQVPAGEDNLFLGPNNLLYFYDATTPIKGTRAYFHIKGVPHPSQSIRHANIITNDQVVTSIDFTKGENNKVLKAIENGQLIIIRNGERFTVQGQRIR